MRAPRFHVPELPGDEALALPDGAARHVARVLRLRPGATIELFDGDGHAQLAELIEVTPRRARARRLRALPDEPPAELPAHLLLGLSKGERMDFAIQKAVELGVTRITPTRTARSVVRLNTERLARRQRHWHGVLVAACEQSGRNRLPQLDPVLPFAHALSEARGAPRLLLDPRAGQRFSALREPRPEELAFLVGPEGGLAEDEIERAVGEHCFIAVRLGTRVLRTETAPLALLAAAQTLWGDF